MMTCRYPDNCQKKPDPRYTLCRGCAQSKRMNEPDVKAQQIARLKKANAGKLDWCPPHHLDAYVKMRDGSWTAAEAKAEVLSWQRATA